MTDVMICLPLKAFLYATPFITVLLDSLPQLVNVISCGFAPIKLATCSLARSTAAFAAIPSS